MARYQSRYTSYVPRSVRRKGQRSQKRLIWNIILGIVLLYIVFAWLLPGLIGSLSFLNRFKGSVKSSQDISSSPTLAPPVLNIPYEATNTATIRISGYASSDTKVEIFFDDSLKTTVSVGDDGSFQSDSIALSLGTNNIYGKTVDSKGTESLSSKAIQLVYSNDKPKLDLSSPADNTQIHGGDKKVTVSGNTDSADNINVNGTTVVVNGDGSFSIQISINDGDNNIVVTATNNVGNTTTIARKVTYSGS